MTVEMMIDMLREYPIDTYVYDTWEDPIFWVSERYDEDKVYLEPINWVAQKLGFDNNTLTTRELIEILSDLENDVQVCDTKGSPILWSSNRNVERRVYLEAIDDTDINKELDAFHEEMMECGMSDNDAAQELQDRGFTLDDLRNYSEATYEWAKQTDIDW